MSETATIQMNWKNTYKSSNFAPAFLFLTPERRRALKILYAVCRVLDDAVDLGRDEPETFLAAWKSVFENEEARPLKKFGQYELALEFIAVAKLYKLPLHAMIDLIDKGVAVDLKQNRFQTAMDMESYFYGVAGTVGLACLPIFGVPWNEGKDFAIRLGITVQWINAIRDMGTDAKINRIYFAQDHLEQFKVSERSILEGKATENFNRFIAYEAKLARQNYARALELEPPHWRKELRPARMMGQIYMALLDKIEKNAFPVLHKRIKLNIWDKFKWLIHT